MSKSHSLHLRSPLFTISCFRLLLHYVFYPIAMREIITTSLFTSESLHRGRFSKRDRFKHLQSVTVWFHDTTAAMEAALKSANKSKEIQAGVVDLTVSSGLGI